MAIYNTNIIISMLCLNRLKHSYIHPDLRRRGPRLSPAVVGCDFLGFLPSPSSCSATPQTHPFFRLFRLTNMTCLILCLPFIIHPSHTTQLIKPPFVRTSNSFFTPVSDPTSRPWLFFFFLIETLSMQNHYPHPLSLISTHHR